MTRTTTTRDTILAGRVRLSQPAEGYRVSNDAVFLAASVGASGADTVLDVGCGAGAASLCLAARLADVRVTGLDLDPARAALANENAVANGWSDRLAFAEGDVGSGPPESLAGAFGHVMSNPPYLPRERADLRDSEADPSEIETVPLGEWVAFMAACAAPGGRIHLVHRADRIDEILAAIRPVAGDIRLFPLWPRDGVPAKRVLVAARKGSRGPSEVRAGLAVHAADGSYTEAARAILEDARGIDL
jgi:tRNA1(Val) A37 N6-methylase TrmN6